LSGCIDNTDYAETESIYIEGYVYTSDGEPINNVSILMEIKDSGSLEFTDKTGYFNFSRYYGFPPGTCTLTIDMDQTEEVYKIDIEKNTFPIEIFLPVDEVPNGTFCGYITDFAQKPISGVSVYERERNLSITTDEDGYYCFDNISPGELKIYFYAKGYDSGPREKTRLKAFQRIAFLNLSFPTIGNKSGGINGTIIDAETKSIIEGAEIMTVKNGEIISTFSDENGHYSFTNLTPTVEPMSGYYRLLIVKDGYAMGKPYVDVSSNVSTQEDVELKPLGKYYSLGGFLLDDSGNYISEATIKLSTFLGLGGSSQSGIMGGIYGGDRSWSAGLPATYNLKITSDGYETVEDEIKLLEGLTLVKHYILKKQL
jgi:hypothetical protein